MSSRLSWSVRLFALAIERVVKRWGAEAEVELAQKVQQMVVVVGQMVLAGVEMQAMQVGMSAGVVEEAPRALGVQKRCGLLVPQKKVVQVPKVERLEEVVALNVTEAAEEQMKAVEVEVLEVLVSLSAVSEQVRKAYDLLAVARVASCLLVVVA